jgi:hypothetical protein
MPLRMGDTDMGWAGEMTRELQISFDPSNAPRSEQSYVTMRLEAGCCRRSTTQLPTRYR